jgi:hypothetical protein
VDFMAPAGWAGVDFVDWAVADWAGHMWAAGHLAGHIWAVVR